jgi:HAD superfamily hydrolase (TIGR01509 family)
VDSEPLHRIAWERTFGPRGVVVSEPDYVWSIGRRDVTFAGVVAEKYGLADPPVELRDEKHRHLLELLETRSRTFDGLPELVRALAANRHVGVVSSALRREVRLVLTRFGLADHVESIVCNEDVTRHKPDPEPYLLCAQRLGVEPARCVVFEYSRSGIAAARAAGMPVIGFTSTFAADQLDGADAVVDSLCDTDALVALVGDVQRQRLQV